MSQPLSSALKNWVPYKLLPQAKGEALCKWFYLGDEAIAEPFFNDTISKCKKLLENSKRRNSVSDLSILPQWASAIETIAPTCIIFHVSRCGSTLLSQLLSLQKQNIVLSEVPFFDELLRYGKKNNNMQEILLQLDAAIHLYGAKRNEEQQYVFIKADSWHIHFYKELRQLYPAIPFILLYRRPDEVIHSQQKQRGMQAIPGLIEPELFGFTKEVIEKITSIPFDEYMAMVLESYYTAFIHVLKNDSNAVAVNYNEGGMEILQKTASVTNTEISATELLDMQQRAVFHAKYPEEKFNEAAITEAAPSYLQTAFTLYYELEKIRTANNTI